MLPSIDLAYLTEREIQHTLASEANMTCVLLPAFQLPSGYDRTQADLLLRMNPGYPDVAPDMWWFDPAVLRVDGKVIPATEIRETHLGRSWQRWSRHFAAGQWRSGVDGLQSFLALVRKELERSSSGD